MLVERDAAALAAVAAELAVLDDAEAFPPHFLGRLTRLLACRDAGYCELDRRLQRTDFLAWWEDGEGASEVPVDEGREGEMYWCLRHQLPTCAYRERSNDWTTARIVSDFVTQREFRTTELWAEVYREAGVNYWIDVGLQSDGRHTRNFIFTREHRDFGERDRLMLDLLQPHLQQRYDRVETAAEAVDALTSLEEQVADDPRHVVLCSTHGVIEFASPQSRRLLATYVEGANGRLPEQVLSALRSLGQPVVIERGGRRLTLRASRSSGLIVLLLGEADMRLDKLTPRQRMILDHLARGETDAEIASATGIASATVKKHLEQMYRRLGVHNRTAAAALLTNV